ncbi:Squalestatin S1 biosynthesis cluster protein L1 like [Verticillium longisporum]|nr:Squalestatin S1 biosynthesis cluster protein L1 like [Verticillium longisporum]
MAMHLEGSRLYVGGEFSNSLDNSITGLNNVGVYASDNDTWTALGAGVNGKVIHVVPMLLNSTSDEAETVISFTGNFDQINEFGDNTAVSVSGFAIWVPSQNNWLQNLEGVFPAYSGVLTAAALDVPDSVPLFAGSMSSATLSANGAVTLSERLGQFPVRIQQPSSSSSTRQRRDILSSGSQVSGVVTGAFYNQDDRNVTVLAGHFTATSGGSTLQNLVFINGSDNNAVRGIDSGVSENSTFVAVAVVGDTLFAGGDVSGNINTDTVRGLLTYNLATASHGSQPPGLNGGNGTVSAIEVRPETGDVYVGGAFESAGSFDCPGVCYYSTDRSQWNRPGTGLEGNVSTLLWASESRLIVGGGMQLNDSLVSLVEHFL